MIKEDIKLEEFIKEYIKLEKEFNRVRSLVSNIIFAMVMCSLLILVYSIFSFAYTGQNAYLIFYISLIISFSFATATFIFIVFNKYIKVREKFMSLKKKLEELKLMEEIEKHKKDKRSSV